MKSLKGKTVLITRPADQTEGFVQAIESLGGNAVLFPTIEITSPASWEACNAAIQNIEQYNALVFTSANAVRKFFERVKLVGNTFKEELNRKTIYTIGERTKRAVESEGHPMQIGPEVATAEALAAMIAKSDIRGRRFLFPRGNLGRDVLPKSLRAAGAIVDEVIVYHTIKPAHQEIDRIEQLFLKKEIDIITFFSPSSIRNFLEMISLEELNGVPVAVIGPVTADAAKSSGLRVDIVAPRSNEESLAQAIAEYFT